MFDFEKLRQRLNASMQASLDNHGLLMHGENCFRQIFSINYGVVEYVDRQAHALHPVRIANPIQFTFLKDKGRYASEKELRVALSALGIGQFVLNNGARMEFPQRCNFTLITGMRFQAEPSQRYCVRRISSMRSTSMRFAARWRNSG